MDQYHIRMCHRAVAWTHDVTNVRALGLKGLTLANLQSFYLHITANSADNECNKAFGLYPTRCKYCTVNYGHKIGHNKKMQVG